MAGPTSSILLGATQGNSIIAQVYKVIDSIATERNGNDFYVDSTLVSTNKGDLRPFALELNSITNEYYEISETELKSVEAKFNFYPKCDIGLLAMCNDITDHKILGQLTLKIAEALDGIIDFGGRLDDEKIKKVVGKIYEIDYETAAGHIAKYHVADIEFMRNWLLDKNFYMIK